MFAPWRSQKSVHKQKEFISATYSMWSGKLRVSSYEPGWFSMCSYERVTWLGYRDLGFSNRDLGKRARNFCHINTSSRLPGWILRNSACVKWSMTKQRSSITQRIISFPQQGSPIGVVCFACGIFHIIGNPLNCSDTAKRVTKAMIGTKVITRLRFTIFVLFLLISRQNSSPGSSAFSHLGNRAEFSHMNPRRNSSR